MSATGQRNNNKAFPNVYCIEMSDNTGGVANYYLCFICRKYFNDAGGVALTNLITHLVNDHGWTEGDP